MMVLPIWQRLRKGRSNCLFVRHKLEADDGNTENNSSDRLAW
jgi:hypothetical protein